MSNQIIKFSLGILTCLSISAGIAQSGDETYYENQQPTEWAPATIIRISPLSGALLILNKDYETLTKAYYSVPDDITPPDDAMCQLSPDTCTLNRYD